MQSSLSDQEIKALNNVLKELRIHPSYPTWKDNVSDPGNCLMVDIATAGTDLIRNGYRTPAEFIITMRRILDNCALTCGRTLSSVFERTLASELPGWEGTASRDSINVSQTQARQTKKRKRDSTSVAVQDEEEKKRTVKCSHFNLTGQNKRTCPKL